MLRNFTSLCFARFFSHSSPSKKLTMLKNYGFRDMACDELKQGDRMIGLAPVNESVGEHIFVHPVESYSALLDCVKKGDQIVFADVVENTPCLKGSKRVGQNASLPTFFVNYQKLNPTKVHNILNITERDPASPEWS